MSLLNLSPDELLSTTRSVRKRLDFGRPVEPELIDECLRLALQAPTGGNVQRWHFVVVTDPETRRALGDIYRKGWATYSAAQQPIIERLRERHPEKYAVQVRVAESAQYLADHMHEAPVLLVPCISGRVEGRGNAELASTYGSILPAVWSFMLAARARGLGTSWTTIHLQHEREAAELLGIPYERVTQVALVPVAYTRGTDFKPAGREPVEQVIHRDRW